MAASPNLTLTGVLALVNGGSNAALVAAAGGVIYSTASAMAISAVGATGQLLQSSGTTAPGWTTSTYPATNAVNTLLYASSSNVMAALPSAASGVLVTSAGSVPSISTTLPNGLAMGTPASLVLTNATDLPVAGGGTGNSTFTAYAVITAGTTATGAFQNVSGLGSSGNVLTSNGAGALPTWQAFSGSGTVNSGTAGQVAYYATSTTAVSGGTLQNVKGVATNSSSAAGNVGEFMTSNIPNASLVSISANAATNLTSLSLTAGDWDVWGLITFVAPSGGLFSYVVGGINTTSGVLGDYSTLDWRGPSSASDSASATPLMQRISIASPTTVYLIGQIGISSGAWTFCGTLSARRVT